MAERIFLSGEGNFEGKDGCRRLKINNPVEELLNLGQTAQPHATIRGFRRIIANGKPDLGDNVDRMQSPRLLRNARS